MPDEETRRLEAERDELRRQIDELRAFEREYRARLMAFLEESMLHLKGKPIPDD